MQVRAPRGEIFIDLTVQGRYWGRERALDCKTYFSFALRCILCLCSCMRRWVLLIRFPPPSHFLSSSPSPHCSPSGLSVCAHTHIPACDVCVCRCKTQGQIISALTSNPLTVCLFTLPFICFCFVVSSVCPHVAQLHITSSVLGHHAIDYPSHLFLRGPHIKTHPRCTLASSRDAAPF